MHAVFDFTTGPDQYLLHCVKLTQIVFVLDCMCRGILFSHECAISGTPWGTFLILDFGGQRSKVKVTVTPKITFLAVTSCTYNEKISKNGKKILNGKKNDDSFIHTANKQ